MILIFSILGLGAAFLVASTAMRPGQTAIWRSNIERIFGPGIPDATFTVLAIALFLVLPGIFALALWLNIRWWIALPLALSVAGLVATLGDNQRASYHTASRKELSGLLDIVMRGMRVGMSFEQTLPLAAAEGNGPVARTLAGVYRDISFGIDQRDALTARARRLGLPDFNAFSSLVILQRETGGSLSARLSALMATMAQRRDLDTRLRLSVLEIRLQASALTLLIGFLFVQTFFTNRSNAMYLLLDDGGRQMLAGSICLTLLGLLSIWAAVRFAP